MRALAAVRPSGAPVATGGQVFWATPADNFRRLVLRSRPLAGGPARTQLSERLAGEINQVHLAASATRLAALVISERTGRGAFAFALGGPLDGPLAVLAGDRTPGDAGPYAVASAVAGDTIATAEMSPARLFVHRPGAAPVALAIPAGADVSTLVAEGGVAALAVRRDEIHDPRGDEILVIDLATGAERYRVAVPVGAAFDVQGDGTLAVSAFDRVWWVSPADPRLHRLALRPVIDQRIQISGGRIAVAESGPTFSNGSTGEAAARLVVVDLHGRVVARTPTSADVNVFYDFSLDAGRLAWAQDGCVLTATTGMASAIPAGPCARVQFLAHDVIFLEVQAQTEVPATITCFSAPGGVCRGTVRLRRGCPGGGRLLASAPFDVRQVHTRTWTLPVSRQALRGTRCAVVEAVARDPQGHLTVADGTVRLSYSV